MLFLDLLAWGLGAALSAAVLGVWLLTFPLGLCWLARNQQACTRGFTESLTVAFHLGRYLMYCLMEIAVTR